MKRMVSLFGLAAAAFMATACEKETAEPAPAASVAPVAPAPVASIAPDLREEPAAAPGEPEEPEAPPPAAASQAAPAASEAPKPSIPSGYTTIQRCCNALAAEAKKDGRGKNQYSAASTVCTGLAQKVKTGAATVAGAKTTLRAQLQGVPMPGGC